MGGIKSLVPRGSPTARDLLNFRGRRFLTPRNFVPQGIARTLSWCVLNSYNATLASPAARVFLPNGQKTGFSGLCSNVKFSLITVFRIGTPNTLSDSPGFRNTM